MARTTPEIEEVIFKTAGYNILKYKANNPYHFRYYRTEDSCLGIFNTVEEARAAVSARHEKETKRFQQEDNSEIIEKTRNLKKELGLDPDNVEDVVTMSMRLDDMKKEKWLFRKIWRLLFNK